MSTSIVNNFILDASNSPPTGVTFTASGNFSDLKNSVSFTTDIQLPSSQYKVHSYVVTVDISPTSSNKQVPYELKRRNMVQNNANTNTSTVFATTISPQPDSSRVLSYPFENNTVYKILYEIYITNVGDNEERYKLTHIQYFKYHATPVTISDFTFNDNVQRNDSIFVSGVSLVNISSVDTTIPEDTNDFPAIEFTFQEKDIGIGNPNEEPTERYIVELSYDPSGEYILPYNKLTTGKLYAVTLTANWKLGYSTSQVATQTLYILNRPVIPTNGVTILPLDVEDPSDNVIEIRVDELANSEGHAQPSKIWFEFYNSANNLVAITGGSSALDASGNPASSGTDISGNLYKFTLNEIYIVNGGDGIENGVTYKIKAVVKYDGYTEYPNIPQWRRSDEYTDVVFYLVKPVINSITPYDVQNDGGNDGVHSGSSDDDTPSQIVATVNINNAEYELYAPSHIKFNIYSSSGNKLANTPDYSFTNNISALSGTQTYNILLSDINLIGSASTLTNGTLYRVKAEVTLETHDGESENRESESFTNITFSQNIAPVISLTIANTWELATTNDPSTSQSRFLDSPEFGVSGHFKKTAQFGHQTGTNYYSKHLDTADTKFKLEYQLNTDNSDTWRTVTRAILIQRGSNQLLEDAVIAAKQSTTYNSSGLYNNVVSNSQVLGTSQPEMVFYIPQVQADSGSVKAFDESNQIKVKVTIIDNALLWEPVNGSTEPSFTYSNQKEKVSDNLFIIRRIESYNYTVGAASEPWNSQYKAHYDISTNLLHIDVNDTIVTTNKSNVTSNSNSIIQELDQGWKIVNTGVGTNGAVAGSLPKVNLYFYGNSVAAGSQNSSNSFTVSQINDMGAIIDQHAGAKEYPFFIVYTTPTGSGDKESWYKSKLFYAPQSSGDTIDSSKVGLTLLYTGTDDTTFRPEIPAHRRVRCSLLPPDGVLTNANPGYATERVNLVSLHTSSNASTSQAGSFNFTLQEAGLMTNSPVLSLLVMRFTKKLALNIPVNWKSIYAHSVSVSYRYTNTEAYNTMTFNHEPTLTTPQHVTIYLDPTLGTTVDYKIFYSITNKNRAVNGSVTTEGVFHPHPSSAAAAPAKPDTSPALFDNQFFPESSDYTVTNSIYKTFNNGDLQQNGESSITFDLSFNIDPENRMDGVNVYFESLDSDTGSNITKVRIGSYTTAGTKTITLIEVTDVSGVHLKVIDVSGATVDSGLLWGKYDSANISFEAFRDARVISDDASYNPVSDASVPVPSGFYVESGGQSTFGTPDSNPIWNVPVLTPPNEDASGENIYELSGGVINIDSPSNHYITWPTANDANGEPFTYDIVVTSDASGGIVDQQNLTGPSYVLPIDLDTPDRYVIEIRKVFNGLTTQRERSAIDVIVFHSVKVDTSNMAVSVVNPSNTSSVTLSWEQAVITGDSVVVSNNSVIDEPASFANNIYAHHIMYRIDSSGDYLRLGSGNLIENSSPTLYTLPNTNLGTLYDFVMYVEAQVKYTLNGVVSLTKSSPFDVPLAPVTPTTASTYIVSTIPSIILPHSTPVLMQGSQNPTLLLNLNANGLEDEGFISVVVILTQDGTPAKPEGEQVLLIFPDSSNNLYPFSFPNTVDGSSGSGPNDPRLAGGDSAISAPRNLTPSVLSTDPSNNTYTLTIGTPAELNGRYGLSTLQMPLTSQTNFVNNLPVNYMVILTTRRGTDIGVGEFTYQAIPSVSGVSVTTTNGQYYVNFTLTPA